MTQTQTDYLVACGAPPLPKGWRYEVKYHPDYDERRDKWYTIIDVRIWAGDTELSIDRYHLTTTYFERLGPDYTVKTARNAYFRLYKRPELKPTHLTSLPKE